MAYDDTSIYDLEEWNKRLSDFSNYIRGRELGSVNENTGLILVLAGMLEEVKDSYWLRVGLVQFFFYIM